MSETIDIRAGYTTLDRRLDRIPQHDIRNSEFPVRSLLHTEPRPLRSYTWQVPHHFDQGREGECVAYGIAHNLIARPRRQPVHQLAEVLRSKSLYHRAQQLDPWEGGRYPGAAPQYDGTSVLAGMRAAKELGLITGYHWASTEREIAEAVAYRGPVVIGVNWYAGMVETDSAGYISATGELLGGHCTLLNGINIARNEYRVWQSWGADWGVGGAAKLTRRDLDMLMSEPGAEAVLVVRA